MAERKSKGGDAPRRAAASSSKPAVGGQAAPKRAAATGPKAAGKTSGKRGATRAGKGKRTKGQIALLITKWLVIIGLALGLLGIAGAALFYQQVKLPAPNDEFTTATTNIYYRDGTTKLGDLSVQNRTPISYEEMPQSIKDAALAAEDRTFWTNQGISIRGLVRSSWNILRGGDIASGSTITQQYIKILYLTSERTMDRKFRELALAVKMSRAESKEQILAGYLNTIYFGRGAYGIQAAAQTYFGVDAAQLSVPQAASLAAILNSPAYLDPADPDNATRFNERYNYVIEGMLTMATITQAQHDEFINSPPEFPQLPINQRYAGPKGFLIKMVEAELEAAGLSQAQIQGGGLNIVTTFDAAMQDAMVNSVNQVRDQANQNARTPVAPTDLKIGMASVEVGTGAILAVYGGPDYVADSRNWATTPRPAASSFKPYALVAGLREGFSLKSFMRGNSFTPPGDQVDVKNAGFAQYGPITLQRAVEVSSNTAFVDLAMRIPGGPQAIIQAANDAGVPAAGAWDANVRLPLGAAEVSPVSQAGGFATFANSGRRATNHVVREVKDAKGNVLHAAPTSTEPTIDPDITRDVNAALRSVVERGTATGIQGLGREVAAKTGTNEIGTAITSSWMVAYTKQISTAVMMVAGDAGTGDLNAWSYNTGYYPGVLWLDYMRTATAGQEVIGFGPAANVNGDGRETNKLPSSLSPSPSPTPTPTPTPTPEPTTAAPTMPTAPATTAPPATTEPPPPATTTAPPPATTEAPPPATTEAPPATTQPPVTSAPPS